MRHQKHNPGFKFVKEPIEFDKYTDLETLRFCLGATLYMPATKDFSESIINNRFPGLTTMVMCFEDAIAEEDVPAAEQNALVVLEKLNRAIEAGELDRKDLPLIFFRTRNLEQFHHFGEMLKAEFTPLITGFNFPKFNSADGAEHFAYLAELNERFDDILYGMPILEGVEIAYKETRIDELVKVRRILEDYIGLVLNVRVGATDFSSCFSVRRGIDYTIYDILNTFSRNNDFVLSGPVWEYFAVNKSMKFSEVNVSEKSLLARNPIINDAVDGLLREIVLDRANGFVGKTIIHPSHLNYVNSMLAVVEEEYNDAMQILGAGGGVVKGEGARSNKMNEIRPHTSWAKKIVARATVYGVIKDEDEYKLLFS